MRFLLRTRICLVVILVAGVGAGRLHARVSLFGLFSEHAVLQRDKDVPIWGRADPGERISVSFRGQTIVTTANADGRWKVKLAPMSASVDPADLVVRGHNTLTVDDVLVGDVWLCSGQSNMEFELKKTANADSEIAAAKYPLIRHFKVAQNIANTPAETVAGDWRVTSPVTAGDFTAVGYFFARHLVERLKVPIGLINSTVGGTAVQSWIGPAALAASTVGAAERQRWQRTLADSGEPTRREGMKR